MRWVILGCLAGLIGCGAAFWDDSENRAPTHDLIEGNENGGSYTNGPLFMRGREASTFQSFDAGVDVDADIVAAKAVVDAVKGDL